MDEPDAYLSSQGQQDLLRILEEYALPEDRGRQDLMLDKGATDEGTRLA